ncbi:MAG: hypothetical protein HOH65_01395 [Rhodospirillaceae bacterium]|jgi:lipopolysaccharide export system protein LptA|nr:hypothetical protein [Rhodospirillaceae bacterium]
MRQTPAFGFLAAAIIVVSVWQEPLAAEKKPSSAAMEAITVEADEGIEWLRDKRMYVARGNAKAIRDGVTVKADTLTAHYRDGKTKSNEIHRLEALGHVTIVSADRQAVADRAVYDLDEAVVVLLGDNLKFSTATDVITARESLEYWETKRVAVARGDALATRKDQRIRADALTAYFHSGADGKLSVTRMDAIGNVVITTPREVARGDKGVYNVDKGIATLDGAVRITRGTDQLNGQRAEVNLKTGVSRLLSGSGTKRQRVQGLIVPRKGAKK